MSHPLLYTLNRLLDKASPTFVSRAEKAAWMLAELQDMPEGAPELNALRAISFDPQEEEFVIQPTNSAPRFKLFLGLPVYGAYNAHFAASMFSLLLHRPCEMVVYPLVGDSLVARARNRICAKFLASDCTHLLQLDTDLIFSPEHIARLITHAQAGHDIVAGLYPKKQKELGWVCNILDETQPPSDDGLQKVKYAGTGCLMVSRAVLLTMKEALPYIEYDPDEGDEPGTKWDFFATGVTYSGGRRRYLSEDWMFCERALSLGFAVQMDTQVILKHVGEMIYPLQEIETFADSIAEQP